MTRFTTRYGLTEDRNGGLGLSCNVEGLSLAGVPLLRKGVAGFAPRAADEIEILLQAAYGDRSEPMRLSPSVLDSIAGALNRGELAKAAMTAVFLKLPELDADGGVRLILANDALVKYSPSQPRDDHGRWTENGAGATDGQSKPSRSAAEASSSEPGTAHANGPPRPAPRPDQGAAAPEDTASSAEAGDTAMDAPARNPLLQEVSGPWLPPASRSPYPTGPKGPSTAPKLSAPGPGISEILGEGSARDTVGIFGDYLNMYDGLREDANTLNLLYDAKALVNDKRLKPPTLQSSLFAIGDEGWKIVQVVQFNDPERTRFAVLPTFAQSGKTLFELKTPVGSQYTIWTNGDGKWSRLERNSPVLK